MDEQGEAQRITIYVGEGDRARGRNLYSAVLELLRREGASGATATRGLAGFGTHGRIHTEGIEVLATDLPIRIEWIDTPERVARLLPQLRSLVGEGMIVQEPVTVLHHSPLGDQDPLTQPVSAIMHTEVVSVPAATSLDHVVRLLLERGLRSLPVVDTSGRVVGIITDGDLLRGARLVARLGVHKALSAEELRAELAALSASGATVDEIMTRGLVTARADESVRTAVERMVRHRLKRLPVLNDAGRLVGMVSRIDVFRAVAQLQASGVLEEETIQGGRTAAELMHSDVPTVDPDAPLEQSARRRVVVVDADRHVLGIITDGDLLRRSQQRRHPGLVDRLRTLLTGHERVESPLPSAGERASELMTTPVITVHPEAHLGEALQLMTEHAVKRLPVVDQEGRLLGLLGRSSVLRGLLGAEDKAAST